MANVTQTEMTNSTRSQWSRPDTTAFGGSKLRWLFVMVRCLRRMIREATRLVHVH